MISNRRPVTSRMNWLRHECPSQVFHHQLYIRQDAALEDRSVKVHYGVQYTVETLMYTSHEFAISEILPS
jgi:hypothetical protein